MNLKRFFQLAALTAFVGMGTTQLPAMQASLLPALQLLDSSTADLSLPADSLPPEALPTSDNPFGGDSRGVIGRDDRATVRLRAYPWSAVGRVEGVKAHNGRSYHCTGTLIAPRLVLTNAHCVVDPGTNQLAESITFAPNMIDGLVASPADRAQVLEVVVGTDFTDRAVPPHPNDWAVMVLNKPLGDRFGTIALKPIETDLLAAEDFQDQMIMVGYSGDFPEEFPGRTPSAHLGCSITEEQDDVIYHACDTFGGSSGGPILTQIDGAYYIVALNSAAQTNAETGEGIINYGVKISRIIEQASE